MKSKLYILLGVVAIAVLLATCKKDTLDDFQTTPVSLNIPSYFPNMDIPSDNLLTKEGIALGRKLYYDNILHKNQLMSCASCHDQSLSFTTSSSNSLAHINLGWNSAFLWNGKVQGSLEDIMFFEVVDFFETDISLLNQNENYKLLFKQAYGVDDITSREVAYALAQFFRTMNSYDSKYDKKLQFLANFTPSEWEGYDIYFSERGDCFHCHGTALFHDNDFHNNALDANPTGGLFETTGDINDIGKYKTPTLRNIEFTAPYMHDGRFATLEEVVDFYCDSLKVSPTVDPLMKTAHLGGLNLSPIERINLIAFLKTLSDPDYLVNPELSAP